jgi:3-oxoacyl-[acyl-carrier-protein] synthase-3
MAVMASKKALKDSGLDPEDIDAIIVCTISPDEVLPTISCIVQEVIGAKNAFCYDMNVACSGFVFAYNTALAYMESGMIKNVLIVGTEKLSDVTDWTDRGTCILFGDGAGAAVITGVEGKKALAMHSDGTRGMALTMKQGAKMGMDGQAVFKFAVKSVPEVIEEVLDVLKIPKNDIDYYILHQANARIVDAVSRRLKVDIEKFPMNLNEYGNTSSASIPILLDELNRSGKLVKGQRIVMAGFGAGLSWGASYITV